LIAAAEPAPGLTLFSGRFGSGKTEAAISYALSLASGVGTGVVQGSQYSPGPGGGSGDPPRAESRTDDIDKSRRVVLIDLDIVTPYFRSREAQGALAQHGVEVIAPLAIGRHLDVPAITPQILGAIEQSDRPTVLDVGGDRQGARALGGFSHAIDQRGYTMHFVVNPYRPFTDTLAGLAKSIAEIEDSARLKVTSLISNPNLMDETTIELIVHGHARVEGFAQELGLPVAWICLTRDWAKRLGPNHFSEPTLLLDRFLTHPWEDLTVTAALEEDMREGKERP
jgi:hypothetical protein